MPHNESDADIGIERVPWDNDDSKQSLLNLYAHDTDFARTKIRWYLEDAYKNGIRAGRVRVVAIALGTLGVAIPLVNIALPAGTHDIGAWGYVAIALAAGLFSVDRFGGFSWRWTRSTLIWIALRRELAEFQHDWTIEMLKSSSTDEERMAQLKAFRQNVEAIIAQECRDWVDMMIHARLQLEGTLQRGLGHERGN